MPDLINDELAGFFADVIILASVAAASWWVVRRWLIPFFKGLFGKGE